MLTSLSVLNRGLPKIAPTEVERVFELLVRELEVDKQRVRTKFSKRDRRKKEIIEEIDKRIKLVRQYDTNERYVVVAAIAQKQLLPTGYSQTFSRYIIPNAERANGRRIVEIGFGEGDSFPFFEGWNYTGLETSEYALFRARGRKDTKGKLLLRINQEERFPISNKSIDFVLACNSMCYIPNWQLELDECVRVLHDGATMSVIERTDSGELKIQNIGNFYRDQCKPEQIRDYLAQKGLEAEIERFRGTHFGKAIIPDGHFGFTHVKAIKH